MTKSEIIKKVKERTGLSRQQAKTAVEILLDSIKNSLRKGERVCIVGLGTFYVKKREQRNGRNPKTGDKIFVPEKKIVSFRAGREFREMVKTSSQENP